uniref:Transmembrane domain-containing protein n=1 Tax=Brugia timori TaxID=42155 RepID=A0A0R3R0D3_9BILA
LIKLLHISSRLIFQPFLLPISGKMLSSINESAVMFDDDKNLVRYCVLAFYCFIFGSEIVCKLVRRVFVFILNPCHIATTIQILILAIGITNHRMYYLFRFQMYLLPGALIGIILPSINSRVLFVEVLIYFIQHVAILIVPFFIITEANMGCVICPAMSDPFYGRFYRLATVIHQAILIPLITEVFTVVSFKSSPFSVLASLHQSSSVVIFVTQQKFSLLRYTIY